MKLCADHWNALRDAIKARGLWPLVASSGEEANRRMSSTNERDRFEPLIGATVTITTAVLEVGGPAAIQAMGCPVCDLRAPELIGVAADAQAAKARELGLVGADA